MAVYQYAIAAGHDNAIGLVNIEAIKPTGDKFFVPPEAYSSFDDGVLRMRADGTRYTTGRKSFTWPFKVWTVAQYRYLMTTYTTGGNSYSGPVTVKTRAPGGTYANYNAILLLPELPDLARRYLTYRGPVLIFADAVAI